MDDRGYDISQHFPEVIAFVDAQISALRAQQKRIKVFFHCVQGVNRSAACLCAYLLHKAHRGERRAGGSDDADGTSLLSLCNAIASKRPGILNNTHFLRQLLAWESKLRAES